MYAAIISGIVNAVGDTLGAIGRNSALDRAAPRPTQLGEYTDSFKDYESQADYLPAIADLLKGASDQDNDRYLKGLEKYFPGLSQQLKKQGEQALAYQQGYISDDDQVLLRRNNAYKAFQGGYAASPMANSNLEVATARKALANQAYGNQLAAQTGAQARSLSPDQINLMQTLLTPQDLLKRTDANSYYNADMDNQTRAASAGIQLKGMSDLMQGLTKGFSGIGGYLGNQQNNNGVIGGSGGNSGGGFMGGFGSQSGGGWVDTWDTGGGGYGG